MMVKYKSFFMGAMRSVRLESTIKAIVKLEQFHIATNADVFVKPSLFGIDFVCTSPSLSALM